MNKNIDRIVSQTKGMFTPIAIEYLEDVAEFEKSALADPKVHSPYPKGLVRQAVKQKLEVAKDLKGSPDTYTHKDWGYLANIMYQIYLFHDPKKKSVKLHFLNDLPVNNATIKAHYEYYCRNYIHSAKSPDKELEVLSIENKQIRDHLFIYKIRHAMLF